MNLSFERFQPKLSLGSIQSFFKPGNLIQVSRSLESLLRRWRRAAPTPRSFLVSLHRGELITMVFSSLLFCLASFFAFGAAFVWLFRWIFLFYELERWSLVLSFFDQAFLALAGYYLFRISVLRALHVRAVPGGRFAAMQAAGYLLRWIGEFLFLLSLTYFGHTLLAIPATGIGSVIPGLEGTVAGIQKLLALPFAGLFFIAGFLFLPVFYVAAGIIDTFLHIEQNTREKREETAKAAFNAFGGGSYPT